MLIITDVFVNHEAVPQQKGGANNCKFSLNEVGIGMVIVQVCAEAFTSITPMVIHMIEFGGDSALRDHKNVMNEFLKTSLHKNLVGSKIVLIPVHIIRGIIHIISLVGTSEKRKYCWLI